uniref:B box-type domain-containing protein n=1 Tax=Amphimedon queenslandica TaxID=400682 RepID=A0A1X7TAX7_AMPQE
PAKQEAPLICPIPSHDEPLKIYCETCDSVICRDCTVRTHKDHEYDLVSASYTKHYQELEGSLNPVKGKIEGLKKVLSALAKREGKIRERGEGILEEIHEMVQEVMNVLRQSERKLTEQAKRVTDAKLKMMERMSEITAGINVEALHPKEKADFVLSKDIKSLHHIGDIVSLQQYKVIKIDCITPAGKTISFSLSMEAPDSSVLCVPLSSLWCSLVPVGKGNQPIHTTVTTTSTDPGVYRIQCNPSTSGTHTVKVQVYDVHLEDTSLVIPFNPYLGSITPVHAINGLKGPWGVAKISMDGYLIASVGKYGSGPLQFNYPSGIAISSITGQVYIADINNDRIQVLNPDLTFSHLFGSKGSANGHFEYLRDIAIDSQGLVYVADRDNYRIQKFSPDGKFVGQFGTKGSGPGQLNKPVGITIDTAATGLVYVSEWINHHISVFTSDGVFVRKFGIYGSNIGQFKTPYGSNFDKNGLFYVCDWSNNRLVVY